MCVLRNVFVQAVHVLPSATFAVLVTKQGEPGNDVEITRTAGGWVGHDHLAFVNRFGQVLPCFRLWNVAFFGFNGVEANGGSPHIHAPPSRWIGFVAILGHDGVQIQRRIGLQHAIFLHQRQAGGGDTPDSVGLGVAFFGQQFGSDHAC